MPHDAALEAHEHTEHAEHAAHESDPFIGRVSITIAILAVLAAAAGSFETVEAGGAIVAASEAVLRQDQATDNWGFANSKAVRKNLYAIAIDQNPAKTDVYEKAEKKAEGDEEKAHEKAVEFEKDRDKMLAESQRHEHRHHWLTGAATLLEVGIAISTVAIITKKRLFWFGAMLLGVTGAAIFGYAYLAQ